MITLTERLDDYIAVRRSLGYDLSFAARVLRGFTRFADREGIDHITVDLFLRWKKGFGKADNNTWSARLGMVRVFAGWLQGHDARTEVPPLTNFIGAIIQAEQLGVSISKVLQVQSEQLRIERRQRAEEMAAKAPIKMLFPLVGCIFPSLFIVILGPAIILIVKNLKV